MKAIIVIEYCPRCGWLLRSAYMGQELLSTFVDDLEGVMLKPSRTSGHFSIHIDDVLLFDRKADAGFPEIKQLKQAVRDVIHPGMNLGHLDR